MEIKIDVTDWNEEYEGKGINVSSEEEIIEGAKGGIKPSEMGRLATVAQEKGDMPEGVIPNHKVRLMTGTARIMSGIIAKYQKKFNLKNGKEINGRSYTCATEGVEMDVVVDSDSKNGLQNAINYLRNKVPGYIHGRLVIIAANNGDVEAEAELLIEEIRMIVSRLT